MRLGRKINQLVAMLVALGVTLLLQLPASAEDTPSNRFAVLIGNWDYNGNGSYDASQNSSEASKLHDLQNPCNDIELIAGKLEMMKWKPTELLVLCNASKSDIANAVEEFSYFMNSEDNPFGFFYYAGHGLQVGEDTYVFGTNAVVNILESAEIFNQNPRANLFKGGLRLQREMLNQVGEPGSGSIFIVIDACRDNPIAKALYAVVGDKVKLSLPQKGPSPFTGIRILYSTANGEVASDGIVSNSPFAMAFAEHIDDGKDIDDMIRHVARDLYLATRLTSLPQTPDSTGIFNPPPPLLCFGNCQ